MSEKINDGGPAFPLSGPLTTSDNLGMTLRDYFATNAMTAIVSLDRTYKAETAEIAYGIYFATHAKTAKVSLDRTYKAKTAEIAYGIADAMLAARDKK